LHGHFEITHSACEALDKIKEIGRIIAINDIVSQLKIVWYPKTFLGHLVVRVLTE
jgi:hypothetical protein